MVKHIGHVLAFGRGDELMREARRGGFDVVLVWASDRIARSTRHNKLPNLPDPAVP